MAELLYPSPDLYPSPNLYPGEVDDDDEYKDGYPLLVINGHDYTTSIKAGSYKVSAQPDYEEWYDANRHRHIDIRREVIGGSMTMLFTDIKEYYQFLNDVQESTTPFGYLPVTVYLNKQNELRIGNFFLSYDPKDMIPFIGTSKDDGFELQITER